MVTAESVVNGLRIGSNSLVKVFKYHPYQEIVDEFPAISSEDCARAIHLVEANGSVSKGAEATYRLYRGSHPQSLLLVLYEYLPGFKSVSEFFYKFFSSHRGLLAFITHLFWGRNFQPSCYQLISSLFLRLLGLVYSIAFVSFYLQAGALIGSDGVLPIEYFLNLVMEQYGTGSYLRLPTLFWFSHADVFINTVCITGIIFSVVLMAGYLKTISLILLYLLYLSLVNAGQAFMSFQWDLLLLECGFLAIFLPWGSRIIVWCFRWLVFRFMFLAGVVKIASNDPTWDSLTALTYHFETQPLPSPLSWYTHHLPEAVLMTATGLSLFIELLIPFLIFTPRNIRHLAGMIFIFFQIIILLTGNYNFFNVLTIFMILFLFDDAAIIKIFPNRLIALFSNSAGLKVGGIATASALFMLLTSLYIGGIQINHGYV